MKQQHHKNRNGLCVKSEPSLKRLIAHHALRITHYGFTLVELMIAIFIGMIIIGATYAAYISQQRSFTSQDQVVEMNSTSKIALDMISNDIRETGFGVPTDLTTIQRLSGCLGINGYLQSINITDRTNGTDEITILGGFRLIGNIAAGVNTGSTTLTLSSISNLNTTDRSYISIAGLGFAIITGISGNTLTLHNSTPADRPYPSGVPVYLVENITYQVVNRQLQKIRRLGSSGCSTNSDIDVIAENIDDFQVITVDTNDDGTADRIRINILARTLRPDLNFQGQGNPPAQIENRNHAPTTDSFRRRWWQMEVDLRNQT
ncbi:MAG: prepilin-type N-terminal cleavage/methylation domain-containing protein [Nitrospirota bacterium]